MGFFKGLFNKSTPEQPARNLDHASKLILGDILEFSDSFTLPNDIRKQKFEVIAIETFEFEHQHYPRFKLQGNLDGYLWLSLPGDNNNSFHISLEINRDEVEQLFDLDEFADIFEEGFSEINSQQAVSIGDWHADKYYQRDLATVAFHHREDFRATPPSKYNEDSNGRRFEYYHLHDSKEQKLVDIIVQDNGETDVFLTMQLANDAITGFWPIS